ncbi:nucleoside monophosphate kinase [Microbacterium sp. A8/3-1]|uniref:Adenylate kinase n=1 Tax=Microbacterium sp. A8/3-1 TaxID=3160749 RepID=A0AAU7W1W8_9MICO
MNETLIVTVIGAPASGKSTLADGIKTRRPSVELFGVRRHFHEQIERGTALGDRARPYVDAGGWIPDEIVVEAVAQEFDDQRLRNEVVFEGMPGNRGQAALLDDLLDARGTPLQAVFWVDTPDPVCMARAAGRIVCYSCDGGAHQAVGMADDPGRCARCGEPLTARDGDDPLYLAHRLDLFHRQYAELFGYYGDRVVRIDGLDTVERILESAMVFLET